MSSAFSFDATNVPTLDSREIIPAGLYLGVITDSELTLAQSGGTILKVAFTVTEPAEYRGQKVYEQLNVKNQSPKAEEIGQRAVSSICHSMGRVRIVANTAEIHDQPICAKVEIEKGKEDGKGGVYKDKNRIVDWRPANKYTGPVGSVAGATIAGPVGAFMAASPLAAAAQGFGMVSGTQTPAATFSAPPAPVQAPPTPPAVADQLSPDGKWKLENGGWVPNVAAAPPLPPPAPAPTPATGAAMPWTTPPPAATGQPGPWAQG